MYRKDNLLARTTKVFDFRILSNRAPVLWNVGIRNLVWRSGSYALSRVGRNFSSTRAMGNVVKTPQASGRRVTYISIWIVTGWALWFSLMGKYFPRRRSGRVPTLRFSKLRGGKLQKTNNQRAGPSKVSELPIPANGVASLRKCQN